MIPLTSALVLLVVMLASAVICHKIAKKRGRKPVFWGVMGALFGPIAIPFIFFQEKESTMINEALRALLISLKDKDFELRGELLKQGTLYEGYDEKMEALHIENAEKLNEIIKEHGWPGRSQVGKDGADAAFILAQHAISKPGLQKYFFKRITEAVKVKEATSIQAACLEDRILFNQAKPLKYGMLFDWDEAGVFSTNVDNVALANERRKTLGLKTIEEATISFRKEVATESGGPPADYYEHKRLEKEWAKRVGWIQ